LSNISLRSPSKIFSEIKEENEAVYIKTNIILDNLEIHPEIYSP
jgi:hypothetical protein